MLGIAILEHIFVLILVVHLLFGVVCDDLDVAELQPIEEIVVLLPVGREPGVREDFVGVPVGVVVAGVH